MTPADDQPQSEPLIVDLFQLIEMCAEPLRAAQVPDDDARLVAETIVRSEAEGALSHGVIRLPQLIHRIQIGVVEPRTRLEVISDGPATAALNANNGIGQIVAERAMRMAISKASEVGVAIVTARESSHFGRAGHSASLAAEEGLIGMAASNASPRVVAEVGARPILGNNPWAAAVPTDDKPLVVDMANSIVAAGKIRVARAEGSPIPQGWALDSDGEPTTDPDAALSGALFAVGEHKGWAISLVVDALTGLLSGGAFGNDVSVTDDLDRPQRSSQIFAAIDPSRFVGTRDAYADRASELATRLSDASGPTGRLPGRHSQQMLRKHRRGPFELRPVSAHAVAAAYEQLGLEPPATTT